jgi:hypothetical protein
LGHPGGLFAATPRRGNYFSGRLPNILRYYSDSILAEPRLWGFRCHPWCGTVAKCIKAYHQADKGGMITGFLFFPLVIFELVRRFEKYIKIFEQWRMV